MSIEAIEPSLTGLPRLLTSKKVAAALHISERTLRKWCAEGKGPPYTKPGRAPLFSALDVRAFIAGHTYHPAP
jgi:hypothetical protein